jgi:hypothetical protein
MAVTRHGHHIPDSGNEEEDKKVSRARCGGIHHCKECQADVEAWNQQVTVAPSMHFEEQIDWNIDANQPAQSFPAEIIEAETDLEKDLGHILNKHSAENESGTPDFILAMYLKAQLDLFNQTIKNRAAWRGESVELPALQRLHRDTETMDRVIKYLNQLVVDGVIVINQPLEATDIYRGIMDQNEVDTIGEGKIVPLVSYEGGHRNEIGTATVQVTPGEIRVEGKIITSVEALFADPGAAHSIDLDEPRPTNRFERYQKEGFNTE